MNSASILSICGTTALAASSMLTISPAWGRSPVVVAAPADRVVRLISYTDPNLASAAGYKALHRKVSGAITDLCHEANGWNGGSVTFKRGMIRCSGEAWEGARPQIALAVQRARETAKADSAPVSAAAITIEVGK